MKILYVSQYFPPEMGAPAARVSELSRYWVRAGHEVTVLTGFPNHPTGKLEPAYRERFHRLICREWIEGVEVLRTWLWPLPNRKSWERMLNYSSFWLSASFAGLTLERPEVVIGTSPQLLTALAGWWLAKWHNVPFIFEVRDLWPESLAAVGAAGEQSSVYRVLKGIAGFLYRRAAKVIVVSPAFKPELIANWAVPASKIETVENGVETKVFTSGPSCVRSAYGLHGKFLVSYIGTMGMAHGLNTLLDCAGQLQRTTDHIAFLLVGEGAEKQQLKETARSRGLKNVFFVPQQKHETIPAFVRASDACLVTLIDEPIFKTVIPTKMLEFMSCGKPVILAAHGQASEILQAADAGICAQQGDANSLTAAIRRLQANPTLARRLGENGQNYIRKNFAREDKARDYVRLLESAVLDAIRNEKRNEDEDEASGRLCATKAVSRVHAVSR